MNRLSVCFKRATAVAIFKEWFSGVLLLLLLLLALLLLLLTTRMMCSHSSSDKKPLIKKARGRQESCSISPRHVSCKPSWKEMDMLWTLHSSVLPAAAAAAVTQVWGMLCTSAQ
jgi:hypothetical protein